MTHNFGLVSRSKFLVRVLETIVTRGVEPTFSEVKMMVNSWTHTETTVDSTTFSAKSTALVVFIFVTIECAQSHHCRCNAHAQCNRGINWLLIM